MKILVSSLLLILLPEFLFSQQTLARWNANQNVSADSDGFVNTWTTSFSGPSITATSPSLAFSPRLIPGDSSLRLGNAIGFSPGVSSLKYMSFPTLSINTCVVFFVGNLPALINEIHFLLEEELQVGYIKEDFWSEEPREIFRVLAGRAHLRVIYSA